MTLKELKKHVNEMSKHFREDSEIILLSDAEGNDEHSLQDIGYDCRSHYVILIPSHK